jgi:hypothetical protein
MFAILMNNLFRFFHFINNISCLAMVFALEALLYCANVPYWMMREYYGFQFNEYNTIRRTALVKRHARTNISKYAKVANV